MNVSVPGEIAQAAFRRDGYVVAPGLIAPDLIEQQLDWIRSALNPLKGPAEFEADVGYPGAPADRAAPGGQTPRRLLQASRDMRRLRTWRCTPRFTACWRC